MPFTIADRVQYMDDDAKGVVSVIFAEMAGGYNNLLMKAPIDTVDEGQGSIKTVEDEGPTASINSRPLYGAYNEGTPGYRNRAWKLGNYGTRAMVDEYLSMQKNGGKLMDDALVRKAKALNRKVNADFLLGDTATNPNGMDGLKKWLAPNNTIKITDVDTNQTNGANVTNGAASLTALQAAQRAMLESFDLGLRYVGGRDHPDTYIVCNDDVARVAGKAVRELGWFGVNAPYFDKNLDQFGGYKFLIPGSKNPVKTYFDSIKDANAIIPNNFTFGTSSITTEVWFVRFGIDDGVHLKQLRDLKTEDIGRLPQAPIYVKELSWYLGTYAANDFCIAKLTGLQVVAAARP